METQREALIRIIAEIIEPDTGSQKVARVADAAIAVCEAYPRIALLAHGGTVEVTGRTSQAQEYRVAKLNLPEDQRIVTIGMDMAAPGGEITGKTTVVSFGQPKLNPEFKITVEPRKGLASLIKKLIP